MAACFDRTFKISGLFQLMKSVFTTCLQIIGDVLTKVKHNPPTETPKARKLDHLKVLKHVFFSYLQ